MKSRIAAMVKNDFGDLLVYTCATSKQKCEELAVERYTKEGWAGLLRLGCKIVQVRITELDD
jgi:hypothetical protein